MSVVSASNAAPSGARVFTGVAVAVSAVSSAAIFVRFADAPPLAVSFWRCFAGALFFATAAGVQRRRQMGPAVDVVALPHGAAAAAGVLLALHFATWITSLHHTSVAISVVLVCTQPIFVTLASGLFLDEKPPWLSWVGIAVAFAGAAGVALAGDSSSSPATSSLVLGPGLALAGAVFVAGYMLLSRASRRRGAPLAPFAAAVYFHAAWALALLSVAFDQPLWGYTSSTWGWILCLSLLPQVVGHTLLHWAMAHVPAALLSSAILLEPVLSTLFAHWFLDETPPASVVGFAVLVMVGLLVMLKAQASAPPPSEAANV